MIHVAPRKAKVETGDVFHLREMTELNNKQRMKRGYYLVVDSTIDSTDPNAPGSNKVNVVLCGNAPERRISNSTKVYTFNQVGENVIPPTSEGKTYLGPQNIVGKMFKHQTIVFNDQE